MSWLRAILTSISFNFLISLCFLYYYHPFKNKSNGCFRGCLPCQGTGSLWEIGPLPLHRAVSGLGKHSSRGHLRQQNSEHTQPHGAKVRRITSFCTRHLGEGIVGLAHPDSRWIRACSFIWGWVLNSAFSTMKPVHGAFVPSIPPLVKKEFLESFVLVTRINIVGNTNQSLQRSG